MSVGTCSECGQGFPRAFRSNAAKTCSPKCARRRKTRRALDRSANGAPASDLLDVAPGSANRTAYLPAADVAANRIVAALFVEAGGSYFGLPDVDPWDRKRDARNYSGPHPVVAHPPCERWCRLSGLVEARYPQHPRGLDAGCFAAALAAVRRFGGVLEHPAWSDAWPAHGLAKPPRTGWGPLDDFGGSSCYVEQGRYGHLAKKATWLYAAHVELPELRWGRIPDHESKALVSWCGNHTRSNEARPRLGKKRASHTPVEFREVLLAIARTSRRGKSDFGISKDRSLDTQAITRVLSPDEGKHHLLETCPLPESDE